jgi:predicted outer membrane repeat protein
VAQHPGLERIFAAIVLAAPGLPSPNPAFGTEYSVQPDGSGDFPTIQAAVDAAAAGDVIVLENGTFTGAGNRDVSFFGKNVVVRSRNGAASCTIDSQGSLAAPHRAFRLDDGETSAARVEGLTITGGYVSGPFPECGGGGILVAFSTSPTIANCVFEGNESGFQGFGAGLLAWENCDLTLTDCEFRNNVSGWYGGGFTLRKDCDALVERCVVAGNRALHAGGGASITRSNAIVNDCVFVDNEIDEADGGGVLVKAEAEPVFTRCVFAGNRAPWGAALGIGNFPIVTAIDCLFENNTAGNGGAIEIGQDPSTLLLTNCTLVFNEAMNGHGGHLYAASTATVTVRSSIFGAYCGSSGIYTAGSVDVDCSVVAGGSGTVSGLGVVTWGASNVDADAMFCAPDPLACASDPPVDASYHLDSMSPAAPEWNACGLVGAYPVACGATAVQHGVEATPWSRIKAAYRGVSR